MGHEMAAALTGSATPLPRCCGDHQSRPGTSHSRRTGVSTPVSVTAHRQPHEALAGAACGSGCDPLVRPR
jgi:hypothetical protein